MSERGENMENGVYKVTLEAARVNAGLSQAEASKKIGISRGSLIKYEKNEKSMTVDMLKRICEVYKVPLGCISFLSESSI